MPSVAPVATNGIHLNVAQPSVDLCDDERLEFIEKPATGSSTRNLSGSMGCWKVSSTVTLSEHGYTG